MADYVSTTGASGFVAEDEQIVYSLKNGTALNLISGEGWKKENTAIRTAFRHTDS